MSKDRRPKCYGSPGIDPACESCGLRVECFDEFNDDNEWNLLLRTPTLSLFDKDEALDPLSVDALDMRSRHVTLPGAKALLRAAERVHVHTGIPIEVVKTGSGVVTWRWKVRQKRKSIFAEVKKATARCLKLEIKVESKLLRSFVKPNKKGKTVLQADPEIEDDLKELVYHLCIVLQDLTVKT